MPVRIITTGRRYGRSGIVVRALTAIRAMVRIDCNDLASTP